MKELCSCTDSTKCGSIHSQQYRQILQARSADLQHRWRKRGFRRLKKFAAAVSRLNLISLSFLLGFGIGEVEIANFLHKMVMACMERDFTKTGLVG